ncbi:MAG: hypothetical protein IJ491_02925 [Clostridia bacterium]|nr:hypothetical protein [Clostridia bacterium]
MKEYIRRLRDGCPKGVFALWWVFRLLLIYAFVSSLLHGPSAAILPVQLGLSLVLTFAWEICMAFPSKSFLSFLPSGLQTILTIAVFASVFCGKFMNWFYDTSWFEPLLQFLLGAVSIFFGYEISWAIMKKEKRSTTKAMAFYVAFGLFFVSLNLCELFEFSFDQIVGIITGQPSDLQHWSFALAEGTASQTRLLPPIDDSRYPIMATMLDIILSTVGAFTGLLIVNIFPYRHKGRFRYKVDFEVAVAVPLEKHKATVKEVIKAYIQRLRDNCSAGTYILWWLIRLGMVFLFIEELINGEEGSTAPVELLMNLACMFIWEISMAMPQKNVFRFIHPVLQTIITVCVFITVLAGHVFNFYYEVRLWDSILHFLSGIVGSYFGYEITCALFKLEKKTASLTQILIASVGFCFMCTTLWEIFEFSCDQIVGMMSGTPNDVQHWSFELAKGTAKEITIIDPIVHERWPLMDTMIDIVLNTTGSFLAFIGLKIYPYRHKGRFASDFDFDKKTSNESVKTAKTL